MRKPHFSKERKRWLLRQGTKNVDLGPDKEPAFKKYHALMAGQIEAPTGVLAVDIIAQFLDWSQLNQKESTYKQYAHYLKSFGEHLGRLKLSDLKPFHVARWVAKHSTWGDNAQNCAVRAAVRPFSWAAKLGVISHHPLAKVDRPASTPRECELTDEQYKLEDEEFRDLLTIMRETGCRPQEARRMEARHFNRSTGTITFSRQESKGGKKQRVIVLTDTALAVVQRLTLKYPSGPILRNTAGITWKASAIIARFGRLSKKLGFPITAYHLRHAFCTNALLRGVEPLTVATLMGHSSITMIWSVYQHLQLQTAHMRKSAEQATGRKQA